MGAGIQLPDSSASTGKTVGRFMSRRCGGTHRQEASLVLAGISEKALVQAQ